MKKHKEDAYVRMGKTSFDFMAIEVVLVAILLGIITNSWLVFSVALILLIVMFTSKRFIGVLAIILSIMWGYFFFKFGQVAVPASIFVAIVMAFIAFVVSWVLHSSAVFAFKEIKK